MEDLQQILVGDHISDLLRDAEGLRAERLSRDLELTSGRLGPPTLAPRGASQARVRFGRWLIGVGAAVAGTTGDPHGETAGHAT